MQKLVTILSDVLCCETKKVPGLLIYHRECFILRSSISTKILPFTRRSEVEAFFECACDLRNLIVIDAENSAPGGQGKHSKCCAVPG